MKKVIWVFGESATGKLKLINDILSDRDNIRTYLGIEKEEIDAVSATISQNLSSFDDSDNEMKRRESILSGIEEFMNSDNTLLFIKGQCNDMDDKFGNTLKEFATKYPDLEKEIFLLEVRDVDMHYNRFINKDWYKVDPERYGEIFTREWLPKAVEKHRMEVYKYEQYGFKVKNIDSTDGFILDIEDLENILT